MQQALRVSFHNLPKSEALDAEIRERFARLEKLNGRIVRARVVVDSPHRGQGRGKTYAVRIEIGLPGEEIMVAREPVGELRLAVEEAFDALRRQMKEHAERRRGG